MQAKHLQRLIDSASQSSYSAGETIVAPVSGVPTHLLYLRQGLVLGRAKDDREDAGFEFEPGDLFPIGAVMAARAVTSRYSAHAVSYTHLTLPTSDLV